MQLRITEIFHSLQGEARSVGLPTVFVRLTGCPLRCTYCDTAYAFYGGEWSDIEDIVAKVAAFGVPNVCVTGGEPLVRRDIIDLFSALGRRLGHGLEELTLTTNGTQLATHAEALARAGVRRVYRFYRREGYHPFVCRRLAYAEAAWSSYLLSHPAQYPNPFQEGNDQ
mgnify:CR=1 FL=1